MINYYHILGISEQASSTDIKKAFKTLALRYHPDRNPDDPQAEERFKLINEAYQVLSDAYKKSVYDQWLRYENQQQTPYIAPVTPSYQFDKQRRPQKPVRQDFELSNWQASLIAVAVVAYFFFVHISITTFYSRLQYFWAFQAYQNKNYQEAIIHINNSVAADQQYARAYFLKGVMDEQYYKAHSAALENFDKAIYYSQTEHLEYFWHRGVSFCHINKPQQAQQDINKVIAAYPDSVELYLRAAEIFYEQLSDKKIAEKYYAQILRKGVRNATLFERMANIEKQKNHLEKALQYLDSALILEQNATIFYQKALIYSDLQRMGEACLEWQNAKSLDKKLQDGVLDLFCNVPSEQTLLLMVEALQERQETQKASTILDSLLNTGIQNENLYWLLAKNYLILGQNQQACQAWQNALRLNTNLTDQQLQKLCN